MRLHRAGLTGLFVLGVAVGIAAANGSLDKTVNDPPRAWTLYGGFAHKKQIKDSSVSGGIAERITVDRRGGQPYDAGAMTSNVKSIKKGDVLLFAFWARAEDPPEGEDAVTVIARLQETFTPYVALGMQQTLHLGKDWKLYYAHGVAAKDYGPGNMSGSLHIATGEQVFDLGPVFILDFGAGYPLTKLPHL